MRSDRKRYNMTQALIAPRRPSTSALIRISLAGDHAIVDVHMGRC